MDKQDGLNIPFSGKRPDSREEPSGEPAAGRRFRIPAAAIFGFLCCLGVIGVILYMNQKEESVSLLGTLQPSFAGYSGAGRINGEFHPEDTGIKELEEYRSDWNSGSERAAAYDRLIESISCSFSRTADLRNGDEITYACTYDAKAAEDARVTLSGTEKKYTVAGLSEYRELNVFEGIEADWAVDADGVRLNVNIPDKFTQLGITYTWEYGDAEKPVIRFLAEYDEEKLREAGYVVRQSTHEMDIVRKPVRLDDPSLLSAEEKEVIQTGLRSLLESELESCEELSVNDRIIQVEDIRLESFNATIGSFFDHDNVEFIVTYRMSTDYRGFLDDYTVFEASYRIVIYRLADGSVSYFNKTAHGCRYNGIFGRYSLEERSQTTDGD